MNAHDFMLSVIQKHRGDLTEATLTATFAPETMPDISAHSKLAATKAFADLEKDPANTLQHLGKAMAALGRKQLLLSVKETLMLVNHKLKGFPKSKTKFSAKKAGNQLVVAWENGPSNQAVEEYLSDMGAGKPMGYVATESGVRIEPYGFLIRRTVSIDKEQAKKIHEILVKDGMAKDVPFETLVGSESISLGGNIVPGKKSFLTIDAYKGSKKEIDKVLGFELVEAAYIKEFGWTKQWRHFGTFP